MLGIVPVVYIFNYKLLKIYLVSIFGMVSSIKLDIKNSITNTKTFALFIVKLKRRHNKHGTISWDF